MMLLYLDISFYLYLIFKSLLFLILNDKFRIMRFIIGWIHPPSVKVGYFLEDLRDETL